MKMTDSLSSASEALMFYVANTADIASFEIASLTKALKEEKCSLRAMEVMENAKRGYMKIRHDGYIVSEVHNRETNIGYYNMREFLRDMCSGINSYLSGIFEVDIEYRADDEDNINLNFDASLVEKVLYDVIFGLLCEAGVKNKRVTVYAKDLSKHFKICLHCDGACRQCSSISDRSIILSGYGDEGLGCYAEFAMSKIGGQYKCTYGSNGGKIEIYIPKNLKNNQLFMREAEMKIILGERVMVHKMCGRAELCRIFDALKFR